MRDVKRSTHRPRGWEHIVASPERVLVALFVFSVLSVLVAVGLNVYLAVPQWNYLDVLKTLAILLGISGAVYQFVLRNTFESALLIDVTVSTHDCHAARFATNVEVRFKNIGNRRITAPAELSLSEIEKDYEGSILYPADLSIRRVQAQTTGEMPDQSHTAAEVVTWYPAAPPSQPLRAGVNCPPTTLKAVCDPVSLLADYSKADGKIEFFMEPGEEYCFSNLILLPPGDYLAKIVFVGTRAGASEYWSRIAYFCVPSVRAGE